MEAAKSGSDGVLALLLDHGANVDHRDKEGRTALIWAATKGDWPDIIASLIRSGARVGHQDRAGHSALSLAKLLGHRRTAEILSHNVRTQKP